jgi:hypothetical protein
MEENMMELIFNLKDLYIPMIFIMKSILSSFTSFLEIVKKTGKSIELKKLKEFIIKRRSNIILIHIWSYSIEII